MTEIWSWDVLITGVLGRLGRGNCSEGRYWIAVGG